MNSKSFAVVIAVLAVIGLLGFGLLSKGEASLAVGDRAPDKELARLGQPGTGEIADYRGNPAGAELARPCLTQPSRYSRKRTTGLEPATSSLGSSRSTY